MDEFWEKYKTLLISVGVLILSIIMSLLLLIITGDNSGGAKAPEESPVKDEMFMPDQVFSINEFQFEELEGDFDQPGMYRLRPQMERWDDAQVKELLFPPEEVILGIIEKETRKTIENFFSKIK